MLLYGKIESSITNDWRFLFLIQYSSLREAIFSSQAVLCFYWKDEKTLWIWVLQYVEKDSKVNRISVSKLWARMWTESSN